MNQPTSHVRPSELRPGMIGRLPISTGVIRSVEHHAGGLTSVTLLVCLTARDEVEIAGRVVIDDDELEEEFTEALDDFATRIQNLPSKDEIDRRDNEARRRYFERRFGEETS